MHKEKQFLIPYCFGLPIIKNSITRIKNIPETQTRQILGGYQ